MAVLTKGSFSLDLALVKLTGDLSDDDRQSAWELYTEIATRIALTGKQNDRYESWPRLTVHRLK
jgi:hypothetical protein